MFSSSVQLRALKLCGLTGCNPIDLVLYSAPKCQICEALKVKIKALFENDTGIDLHSLISFHEAPFGVSSSFEHSILVVPRMLPTLVAFQNESPILGWEGFASKAQDDIQDDAIVAVIVQMIEAIEKSVSTTEEKSMTNS